MEEAPEAHTVTNIIDSVVTTREIGFISFVEHNSGEKITIEEIDLNTKWIKASFEIPILGYSPDYPTKLSTFSTNVNGLVTGQFHGNFEFVSHTYF